MEVQELKNKLKLLTDDLYDDGQQEKHFVKMQIHEVVMTAKHEAAVCHPELVELWKAQEHLKKACHSMASYIGSVANRVLGSEMKDRCTLSFISVCEGSPNRIIFSINLGADFIAGYMIEQLVTEIGKPCSTCYWITSKTNSDGKTETFLEFSGVCSEYLTPFFIYRDWNLGDDNEQPILISEERRSKLEESLYTIPEDVTVTDVHLPIMLGDTPCIEATVNGEPRSDMLSQFDYHEYDMIKKSDEKKLLRMTNYLVCKYLLNENCSWVTDGIPLCYVNREDESKISVREYYSLPASLRTKYVLYDRRWNGCFDNDNFVKDGRLDLVKWLESIRNECSMSFYLHSKRGSSRTIREVLENWEKNSKKVSRNGKR